MVELVTVIAWPLLATRFPFASLTEIVSVDVPFVPPAFATMLVGLGYATPCMDHDAFATTVASRCERQGVRNYAPDGTEVSSGAFFVRAMGVMGSIRGGA